MSFCQVVQPAPWSFQQTHCQLSTVFGTVPAAQCHELDSRQNGSGCLQPAAGSLLEKSFTVAFQLLLLLSCPSLSLHACRIRYFTREIVVFR